MDVHLTGIVFWNKKTRKWQHCCLPIVIENIVRVAKKHITDRAKSFGLAPISDWQESKNVHFKDFQTEFGELRRGFLIPKNQGYVIECVDYTELNPIPMIEANNDS